MYTKNLPEEDFFLAKNPDLRFTISVNHSIQPLPFKVSVLIFIKDANDRFLLLKRSKAPNQDCWTPIGGKLEMQHGESPFECAIRETQEEAGLYLNEKDLHLFAMISEKSYENKNHWLLFLFQCLKPIDYLPDPISEGHFGFFTREEIESLHLPRTDKNALWPIYDRHRDGFVVLRADCHPDRDSLEIILEQSL